MPKFLSLMCLFVFLALSQTSAQAQFRIITKLAEVKTIFVDEQSFRITMSSCGRRVGGLFIPCQKDNLERAEFFVHLKRWLGKYGFSLVAERDKADAVLQGTIMIDDDLFQKQRDLESSRSKKKKGESGYESSYVEPTWTVSAWLENDYREKIWKNTEGIMPGVSYKPSDLAKVEAKKLARKLQYDYKKAK